MRQSESPKAGRPRLTKGYGVDRRATKGVLPWSYVTKRMASARNYWVATARPDGCPHVTPVWGLWLEDRFCFATDPKSVKARNVRENPAVSVHLESGDEVVILEGAMRRMDDSGLLKHFVEEYEAKYKFRPNPDSPDHGIYYLEIAAAFAWREKDFTKTATRWAFGKRG